jgi:hypothetical protein
MATLHNNDFVKQNAANKTNSVRVKGMIVASGYVNVTALLLALSSK